MAHINFLRTPLQLDDQNLNFVQLGGNGSFRFVMAGLVQACPGHPRSWCNKSRTWMPGTSRAKPGHDGYDGKIVRRVSRRHVRERRTTLRACALRADWSRVPER